MHISPTMPWGRRLWADAYGIENHDGGGDGVEGSADPFGRIRARGEGHVEGRQAGGLFVVV